MTKKAAKYTGEKTARFCIMTILYQDVILYHLKVYMTSASAVIILLYLAGKIGSEIAFSILIITGMSIFGLMWFLIMARKKSLLGIEDPVLRETAHNAMIAYLSRKKLSEKEKRVLMNRLNDRSCYSKRYS